MSPVTSELVFFFFFDSTKEASNDFSTFLNLIFIITQEPALF